MRDPTTYRQARRNAAKRHRLDWRNLPFAALKLKHSRATITVRATPLSALGPRKCTTPTPSMHQAL